MSRSRQKRVSRSSSSRVPIVEPTTDSCRKNTRLSSAAGAWPGGGAGDDQHAARLERLDRVAPGGLPDGLHHRVDALGQPGAGFERLVGAELQRLLALALRAAGHPHARAGGAAEHGQRGRHAARGALHEHGLARGHAAAREQHPVGGQPRGGQAGGVLEGQLGRLGDDVALAAPPPARPASPDGARTAAIGAGRASRRRARSQR